MLSRTLQLPLSSAAAALAVLLSLGGLSACRSPACSQVIIETATGEVAVDVELALTPAKRQRGLMFRDRMASNRGMLFVFPDARPRSFWMKNTPLPLDILYIDSRSRIVSIARHTEPYSTRAIPSAGAAEYVLEVNGGFADRNGLQAGQTVRLPDFRAAAVR